MEGPTYRHGWGVAKPYRLLGDHAKRLAGARTCGRPSRVHFDGRVNADGDPYCRVFVVILPGGLHSFR